ncbi:unnamed protein product [Musa hybrid cultivar]
MAGRGVIQCHELKMRNSKTRCQLPHAMWCVAVDPNIQFHLPLRATNHHQPCPIVGLHIPESSPLQTQKSPWLPHSIPLQQS